MIQAISYRPLHFWPCSHWRCDSGAGRISNVIKSQLKSHELTSRSSNVKFLYWSAMARALAPTLVPFEKFSVNETKYAVLGSCFGGLADGGANSAVFLSSVTFKEAAFFSLSAFCFSVRTRLLGFAFAFALVFRFGFALVAFSAAGFFAVGVRLGAVVVVLADAVVFLFDAVARPVCAFGLPGRLAGVAVA